MMICLWNESGIQVWDYHVERLVRKSGSELIANLDAVPMHLRLPSVNILDYLSSPDECGLYIIYDYEQVYYVGESVSLGQRLNSSHEKLRKLLSDKVTARIAFLFYPWWLHPEFGIDCDWEAQDEFFKAGIKSVKKQMRFIEWNLVCQLNPLLNK